MGGVICNEFFFVYNGPGHCVLWCCVLWLRFVVFSADKYSAVCMYACVCVTALHPEGEKYEIVNSR